MQNLFQTFWTKLLLVLSLLSYSQSLFSQQVQRVQIKKEYIESDFYPQIKGYFHGEIPADLICSVQGITTNVGYSIFSYNISYSRGGVQDEVRVFGNQIPDSICTYIQMNNLYQPVYFTNIRAVASNGKLIHLEPLQLVPIKEDE